MDPEDSRYLESRPMLRHFNTSDKVLRTAIAAFFLLLLPGCATDLTFQQRAALDYFVGKTRSDLIVSLGNPILETGTSMGVLASYEVHRSEWVGGETGNRDVFGRPIGPSVQNSDCRITFRILRGQVDAWKLDGDGCRDADFPPVHPYADPALNAAAVKGIDDAAPFPHGRFTGDSTVNYGEFNER